MKFTSAFTSLMAAATVTAAPTAEDIDSRAAVQPFGVMSLRSASPIHFGQLAAAQGSLFLNLSEQGATCVNGKAQDQAAFYVEDGKLFLYTPKAKAAQQVYVDRSGMGQGKVGYITGDQSPPRNAELKGWKVVKEGEYEYLRFKGTSPIACPGSIRDSYSVWIPSGDNTPGGNEGCLGFSAMALVGDTWVRCQYTK